MFFSINKSIFLLLFLVILLPKSDPLFLEPPLVLQASLAHVSRAQPALPAVHSVDNMDTLHA